MRGSRLLAVGGLAAWFVPNFAWAAVSARADSWYEHLPWQLDAMLILLFGLTLGVTYRGLLEHLVHRRPKRAAPLQRLGARQGATEQTRFKELIQEAAEQFQALAESARTGLVIINGGALVYTNPEFRRILDCDEATLLNTRLTRWLSPEDSRAFRALGDADLDHALLGVSGKLRLVTCSGQARWAEVKPTPVTLHDEPSVMLTVQDVSEQTQDARLSELKGVVAARLSSGGEMTWDDFLACLGEVVRELFDWVEGAHCSVWLCKDSGDSEARRVFRFERGGQCQTGTHDPGVCRGQGSAYCAALHVHPVLELLANDAMLLNASTRGHYQRAGVTSILDAGLLLNEQPVGVLSLESEDPSVHWDALARRALYGCARLASFAYAAYDRAVRDRKVDYLSRHDSLTGVINRTEFEREVHAIVQGSPEAGHSLCHLDINQFKVINDTCGYSAGDAMLQQFVVLVGEALPGRSVMARLGSDEFGIFLPGLDVAGATPLAERLLQSVDAWRFSWEGRHLAVGLNIGVAALTERGGAAINEAFTRAGVACLLAKEEGRNRYHISSDKDDVVTAHLSEMGWLARIKEATEKGRLELYCQKIQPITPQSDTSVHYELLLRMRDDHGAIIRPGLFIPAAERYHAMVSLDRWVVSQAFQWLGSHQRQLPAELRFSINLSGQSLGDPQFFEFLVERIALHGVEPKRLIFEITETAAIARLAKAQTFIHALRVQGCGFSLDDFGSGLSSFAYLKSMEVEYLKIDGHFVRGMAQHAVDYVTVEAIHRIGHALGLKTVAEFVENEETLTLLSAIGVDYAQGYHLEKPHPLSDLTPDHALPQQSAAARSMRRIAAVP